MKRILAAAALAAIAPGVAAAREPADFTGPRIEARLGYDRPSFRFIEDIGFETGRFQGIMYGVGVGYDLDLADAVVGVEANVDFSDAELDIVVARRFAAVTLGRDIEVAARAGSKLGDNTLLYGKLGYTNVSRDTQVDRFGVVNDIVESRDLGGWRLGLGIEHVFTGIAYGKLEYRYSNYGEAFSRNQLVGAVGVRF